jgi:hypothetical protein
MSHGRLAHIVLLVVAGTAMGGCAREDGSAILGKWRAERLEVMSLKLPVSPELDITRNNVAAGNGINIPVAAITQKGNEVTLDTDSMIGMTFFFEGTDRMYLKVPVMGKIYYRRVAAPPPAPVAMVAPIAAAPAAAVPVVPTPPAAVPPPVPIAVSGIEPVVGPAVVLAPYDADLAQARALVRQGDINGGVRSLRNAFQHGFRDVALLRHTPEFAVLNDDVRYQALLVRYTDQ